MTLTVGVLGPFDVRSADRPVEITAARLQSLLAILAMSAGRVVSMDGLIAAMWDGELPDNARRVVQTYVTRLRGAVGAERISTVRGGYRLNVEPEHVDALRFLRLLDAARAEPDPTAEREQLVQALALWRGTPFDGVQSPWLEATESPRLLEQYLSGLEGRIDLDLAAARYDDLLAELAGLTARHPLRESLWARRLTALQHTGRHAEALACYESVRTLIADELGADPGEQLQGIHADLLAGRPTDVGARTTRAPVSAPAAPALAVVPRQLPAGVDAFVGRGDSLEDLDAQLPGDLAGGGHAGGIVALHGPPGVGKTALAVHWGNLAADRFPDGQLFVNLRGYSTTPAMRPTEALGKLLRGLGVPADQVPLDADEQAALYRSRLAGRRVLVVLDNAADAEQVRPLLAGEPGSLTLVTSRRILPGLIALHDARAVPLGVLDAADSRALLTELLGAARLHSRTGPGRDGDLAGELAGLCGHLPLALRIAAAYLITHPHLGIADYAARLRTGDRLETLSVGDDEQATVRATFDLSYRTLPQPLRGFFRLLGLHAGMDFAADATAALAGVPETEAERLLERLADASLLERAGPGRYAWHDLLRLYAGEARAAEDDPDRQVAAADRLFAFYLRRAEVASALLYPRTPDGAADDDTAGFGDDTDAMRWLDAERANLVTAVELAEEHGTPAVAWRLAGALERYLLYHGHAVEWRRIAECGLTAARRERDDAATATMLHSVGTLHGSRGEAQAAIERFEEALALRCRIGDRAGECHTRNSLGIALGLACRFDEARDHLLEAYALARELDDRKLEIGALGTLGVVCRHMGRLGEARDRLTEVLDLDRASTDRRGEAVTKENLATVWSDLGRFDEAVGLLTESLDIQRQMDERLNLGYTLNSLATAYVHRGRVREAAALARQALQLSRETGAIDVEIFALCLLATCHRIDGRLDEAATDARRAMARAREVGNVEGEAEALTELATILTRAGRPQAAVVAARDAVELAAGSGLRVLEGRALTELAGSHLTCGEYDDAARCCAAALTVHRETGHRPGEALTMTTLSRIAADRGRPADSSELRLAAERLFAEMGMVPAR